MERSWHDTSAATSYAASAIRIDVDLLTNLSFSDYVIECFLIMPLEKHSRHSEAYKGVFFRAKRPQEPTLPPDIVLKKRGVRNDAEQSIKPRNTLSIGPISSETGKTTELEKVIQTDPSKTSSQHANRSNLVPLRPGSPWQSVDRLGTLKQGCMEFILCTAKESFSDLLLFRETGKEQGKAELDLLEEFSHPNVIRIRQAFENDSYIHLGYEYFRHTLQELVHVHVSLNERHVRTIARSVRTKSSCRPVCTDDEGF